MVGTAAASDKQIRMDYLWRRRERFAKVSVAGGCVPPRLGGDGAHRGRVEGEGGGTAKFDFIPVTLYVFFCAFAYAFFLREILTKDRLSLSPLLLVQD